MQRRNARISLSLSIFEFKEYSVYSLVEADPLVLLFMGDLRERKNPNRVHLRRLTEISISSPEPKKKYMIPL